MILELKCDRPLPLFPALRVAFKDQSTRIRAEHSLRWAFLEPATCPIVRWDGKCCDTWRSLSIGACCSPLAGQRRRGGRTWSCGTVWITRRSVQCIPIQDICRGVLRNWPTWVWRIEVRWGWGVEVHHQMIAMNDGGTSKCVKLY